MMKDRDPNYVARCVDAATHTLRRWIVDIGLIAVLFTLATFAAESRAFLEERQDNGGPIAQLNQEKIKGVGGTEPVLADNVPKPTAKSRC